MQPKVYQPEIPVKASETINKYNRIEDILEEKTKTIKGSLLSYTCQMIPSVSQI